MNKPLLILFILIGSLAFGQNLVPNPSFEDYDTCPEQVSDPMNYELEHAFFWKTPSDATSDYFNPCNQQTNNVSVPSNFMGYQTPFHGDSYGGILLILEEDENSWYEYAESELSSTLIQGREYDVSFRVNLSNNANFAVEEIGLWFTVGANTLSGTGKMLFTQPDIFNTNGYLTDTSNWVLIEGKYVANGNESHAVIGYYTDSVNSTALVEPVTEFAAIESIDAYYYIDAVTVEGVGDDTLASFDYEIPNVITPNGDGVNERFELPFTFIKVSILNRWGNLIWNGSDGQYWNGKTQDGVDVSGGTYFYIIETDTEKHQGFVQVVR